MQGSAPTIFAPAKGSSLRCVGPAVEVRLRLGDRRAQRCAGVRRSPSRRSGAGQAFTVFAEANTANMRRQVGPEYMDASIGSNRESKDSSSDSGKNRQVIAERSDEAVLWHWGYC